MEDALREHFGDRYGKPTVELDDLVGPVIGAELKTKAIYALIIGLGLIVLFVGYRYDFKFAICAIIALFHDVLVMLGAMAMSGMVVNSPFVAALLTVVGYSVNDTIVIFDRIRENTRLRKMDPFDRVVNDSLLQTMARSVNTGLTVLFVLAFLFFMGGPPIHSFAFALLVGITSGAYSSIFNASQVLVSWKGREVSARQRVAAAKAAERDRLRGVAAVPRAETAAGVSGQGGQQPAEESQTVAPASARPVTQKAAPTGRRSARPRKKAGGKRRKRF